MRLNLDPMGASHRRFHDRRTAGRDLARRLENYRGSDAIVLGLPRGGVVVAYEIAKAIGLRLDVAIARKLGAPSQPELGIGAIAPGGVVYFDEITVTALDISQKELSRIIEVEQAEMERRLSVYRKSRKPLELEGISAAILVDDGLATGVTAIAAVKSLRLLQPQSIVLAVPVASSQGLAVLSEMVDDVVACVVTDQLHAVGLWYDNFDQVTDEHVVRLLRQG